MPSNIELLIRSSGILLILWRRYRFKCFKFHYENHVFQLYHRSNSKLSHISADQIRKLCVTNRKLCVSIRLECFFFRLFIYIFILLNSSRGSKQNLAMNLNEKLYVSKCSTQAIVFKCLWVAVFAESAHIYYTHECFECVIIIHINTIYIYATETRRKQKCMEEKNSERLQIDYW